MSGSSIMRLLPVFTCGYLQPVNMSMWCYTSGAAKENYMTVWDAQIWHPPKMTTFLLGLLEIPWKKEWLLKWGLSNLQDGCLRLSLRVLCFTADTWHRAKVPPKWDNVMPFVLLSALEVKNTKGDLDALEIPLLNLTTFGMFHLEAPNECTYTCWCFLAQKLSESWGVLCKNLMLPGFIWEINCLGTGQSFQLLRQADGVKPPRKDGKMGWDLQWQHCSDFDASKLLLAAPLSHQKQGAPVNFRHSWYSFLPG